MSLNLRGTASQTQEVSLWYLELIDECDTGRGRKDVVTGKVPQLSFLPVAGVPTAFTVWHVRKPSALSAGSGLAVGRCVSALYL